MVSRFGIRDLCEECDEDCHTPVRKHLVPRGSGFLKLIFGVLDLWFRDEELGFKGLRFTDLGLGIRVWELGSRGLRFRG